MSFPLRAFQKALKTSLFSWPWDRVGKASFVKCYICSDNLSGFVILFISFIVFLFILLYFCCFYIVRYPELAYGWNEPQIKFIITVTLTIDGIMLIHTLTYLHNKEINNGFVKFLCSMLFAKNLGPEYILEDTLLLKSCLL